MSCRAFAPFLLIASLFARAQDITGAGGSFPNPVYSRWFANYSRLRPGVRINYQPVGSGAGIRQVSQGVVDFGATDAPMTDAELAASHFRLLHIPALLGAVVPVYHLPGVPAGLHFAPDVLADIYMGKLTRWDDPRLQRDNPGVALPDQPIGAVYRADGSGSTWVFTDFLCKVSSPFERLIGRGIAVSWPVGIGEKGNEGIAGFVHTTPFSLGYVEAAYASNAELQTGSVRNSAGAWVRASPVSVQAAALAMMASMPSDYRISITNAPGASSFPIASFTWLLIPAQARDRAKAHALHEFLRWMLQEPEQASIGEGFVGLPQPLVKRIRGDVEHLF